MAPGRGTLRPLAAVTQALLLMLALAGREVDRPYKYKSYKETMQYFRDLKQRCPDIVDTWVAQQEFPGMVSKQPWGICDGVPCETLVVRIVNRRNLTSKMPEVFFSGALHGDERIGPITTTELAGFLCDEYLAGDSEVRRLVDTRATWITPMTNAWGYSHFTRFELEPRRDPNRDFPYLQRPEACMTTQTGRTVNELFRRHLFHFMITFHGGERSLTYEWGSRNHMAMRKSTEAPDDYAFTRVAKGIQGASGEGMFHGHFYPIGRITDVVYPVDGGMEDWSYAAGWEASPSPITVCRPATFGGYDPARTRYTPGSIATLVYLSEADWKKAPPEDSLGRTSQLRSASKGQGHVPRNMRMCLKLIELARPEIIVHAPSWLLLSRSPLSAGDDVVVSISGAGCFQLSTARLLLVPRDAVADCASMDCPGGSCDQAGRQRILTSTAIGELPQAVPCQGLAIWEPRAKASVVDFQGKLPAGLTGEFCFAVAAEFDQDWGQQRHPDPRMKPQAHASRARLEEHYHVKASDGEMEIDEYRTKIFPVFQTAIILGATGSQVQAAIAPEVPTDPLPSESATKAREPAVAVPTVAKPDVAVQSPVPVEVVTPLQGAPGSMAPMAGAAPAGAQPQVVAPQSLDVQGGGTWALTWMSLLALSAFVCAVLLWRNFGRSRRSVKAEAMGEVIGNGDATEAEVEGLTERADQEL